MYAINNPSVGSSLGHIASPIAFGRLSIVSKYDYFTFYSLCLDGRPILHFGESPADNFLRKDELQGFIRRQAFQSIFVLDSKRVISAHELDPPSLPQTLPELYELYGAKTFYAFGGVPFHLGDMFELVRVNSVPESYIESFRALLKKYNSLGNLVKQCQPSANLTKMLNHLSKEHFGEEIYSQRASELVFIPTKIQIGAFVHAIKSVWSRENIYMHCASGSGRTGFHVLVLIMLLTHCDFATAFKFMEGNDKYCVSEIKRSYLAVDQSVFLKDLMA